MVHRTSAQDEILAMGSVFHWFEKRHVVLWMTGQERKRHKVTEYSLPRLVKKKLLKEVRWGRKKIYTAWAGRMHIEHGLVCSEALIRIIISKSDCTVISENEFRAQTFGVVAEWGIKYPNGKLLLFEYCTKDNVGRKGLVIRKANMYQASLPQIEEHFGAKAIVLFVLDTKETLAYVSDRRRHPFFYYVDLETFLRVPMGKQLSTPIYIWAGDGQKYALING